MVDVLISPSYEEFYRYVDENKPVVVRDFIGYDKDAMIAFCNSKKNIPYKIGYTTAYTATDPIPLNNPIIDGIETDLRVKSLDTHRIWKHKPGNVTMWHFDGNGADLLNISVVGAKDFYLAPPDSFPYIPLSSVSIPKIPFKETYKVTLTEGDMLYLPSYWFHKVLTLKDSLNVNCAFYPKDRKMEGARSGDLHQLHAMFNTALFKEDLFGTLDRPKTTLRALGRGMLETAPYAALLFLIRIISRWTFFVVMAIAVFLVMRFNYHSWGVAGMDAAFVVVWLLLAELLWRIK
jgi:hypothetical protein